MKTTRAFTLWDPDEALEFTRFIEITVRAENRTHIYDRVSGTLVGIADPECRIKISAEAEISLVHASEDLVWYQTTKKVSPALKSSPTKFTTLDRPPPLTPEMRAVHEMSRRNEIAREQMRLEMEKRYEQLEKRTRRAEGGRGDVLEAPSATQDATDDTEDSAGSSDAAAEPKPSGGDEAAPAAAPKRKAKPAPKSKPRADKASDTG